MDEQKWLTCTDPKPMLRYLFGKRKKRKLALFGVACCRRIPRLCDDKLRATAIDVSERYADRKVKINELRIALRNAGPPARGYGGSDHSALDRFLAEHAVLCNAASNAMLVSEYALEAALHRGREKEDQRVLLREIFGNPFQRVRIRKEWLTATVVALARGIYDERAFDRMPILADALQDAGCDNDDILNHLRDAKAPHVRGCWALDLVLGKE